MFSFNRARPRRRTSLFRGGILSTLLVALAPILYRKLKQKRNAGRLGLREAYAGGNTEW